MSDFSLEARAKPYFEERFPLASAFEKARYLEDWLHKIDNVKSIIDGIERDRGPLKGKTVMDVGSGSGGLGIGLALRGAQVIGIDIEPELCEIATEHAASYHVDARFLCYDGEHMPIEDASVDLITCSSVFEHVSNPDQLLSEMERVLKPGGYVYMTFPNRWVLKETHSRIYFLSYVPRPLADWMVRLMHRSPLSYLNLHFYSYGGFVKILKRSTKHVHVMPPDVSAGWKGALKQGLWTMGKHYTCLLSHVILYLRKDPEQV